MLKPDQLPAIKNVFLTSLCWFVLFLYLKQIQMYTYLALVVFLISLLIYTIYLRSRYKVLKEYHENGVIKLQQEYCIKKGKKVFNGLTTEYYNNGQKKRELSYKMGLKHGVETHFNPIGELTQTDVYENGKLIGCE